MLGHFRRLLTHVTRHSRRRRKAFRSVTAEQLEPRQLLTAVVDLVADLNLEPAGFQTSVGYQNPFVEDFTDVNGLTFFVADTIANGRELWRTDGTTSGTVRLTDIAPGSLGSGIVSLTAVGDTLFFLGNDERYHSNLWKTDGTVAGTTIVTAASGGSLAVDDTSLSNWNGKLFFSTREHREHSKLYLSDGTSEGTHSFADAYYTGDIEVLGATSELLYFSAYSSLGGENQLWRTDRTQPGTFPVLSSYGGTFSPDRAVVAGDRLLFGFSNQGNFMQPAHPGTELWISDGTFEGTVLLADVNPGTGSSNPHDMVAHENHVFFKGTNNEGRDQLWVTSGTLESTRLLSASGETVPSLTRFDDTIYYVSSTGLWKTDGTPQGTVKIREAGAHAEIEVPDFTNVVAAGDSLILSGSRPDVGREIWSYNPAMDRLQFLRDINPGTDGSLDASDSIQPVTVDSAYFLADDGVHGRELWTTDGTTDGTRLVIDLHIGSFGSSLLPSFAGNDGDLILKGDISSAGTDYWKIDGSSGAAARIYDSPVTSIVVGRNATYVTTQDSQRGRVLWRIDETGISRLSELSRLLSNDRGTFVVTLGGSEYVLIDGSLANSPHGYRAGLYRLDSTGVGATLIKALPAGGMFVAANRWLYFLARDPVQGVQLWRTDGTESGTIQLTHHDNIYPGWFPSDFIVAGEFLHFRWYYDFYVTDGTPLGTREIPGVRAFGIGDSEPVAFRNSLFYFAALYFSSTGPAAWGLWKESGTTEPPSLILPITGLRHSASLPIAMVFLAGDEANGIQLFASDATAESTRTLNTFPALPIETEIRNWSVVGDRVLFTVRNRTTGLRQIWVTDGTERGTFPVRHGLESELVIDVETKFVEYAGGIAFAAATEEVGFEVFRIGTQATVPAIDQLTAGSTGNATKITWPDSPGALQYDVWMTSLSHPTMPVVRDRVNSPEFVTDAALQNGAYRIWVRSVSILGETSAWSAPAEFVIGDRPAMYSIPLLSTNMTPTFRWTAAAGTTTHELWLTNRDSKTRPIYARNLTSTSLLVTEPLTPARYAVWVRSKHVDGTFTDWSELTEFEVLVKPTEVISGDGDAKTSRPVFAWNPVAGATGYDIRIQVTAGNSIAYNANNIQGTSHQVVQDLPSGRYTIFVRALRGNRPLSAWNPGNPLWVKLPPAGLRTTALGVAWDAVPYAGSYSFELRDSKGVLVVPRTTQTGTTYDPATPLRPGQYSLRVFANFSNLSSNWSATLTFELFHPPVAITSSGAATVDATPVIAWTAAPGAMQYEVIVTRPGSAVLVYDRTGIKGTSHRIDVPLANGINQIQVRAIFPDGSRSSLSTVQRLLVGPVAVLTYAAGTLSWSPVNQATNYELWINDIDAPSQRRIVYQPLFVGTSYTLPSTLPKGRYQTWLRAIRAENGQLYRGVWTSVTFDFAPVE